VGECFMEGRFRPSTNARYRLEAAIAKMHYDARLPLDH